jgi:hypothetical protein
MALGETIGYSTRATQNSGGNGPYYPTQHAGEIHIALMGDPTLRMHPVLPPTNVKAINVAGNTVVSWIPSTDSAVTGYHVYSSGSADGPFTRLTSSPVTGFTYSHHALAAYYMVRAVKLEESPSGSYFNPSQGVFTKTTSETGGGAVALKVGRVDGALQLSFPTQVGKVYFVEGSPDLKTWSSINTLTANATQTVLRPAASAFRGISFYRVRSN